MRLQLLCAIALLILLAPACQSKPACPPSESVSSPTLDLAALHEQVPTSGPTPTPAAVEIQGKMMVVDRVVQGPLCNDTWSGVVYVTCDVQVAPWDENPTFFNDCDLQIEPGTVVYVAAHNDIPYYKGCSCHFSDRDMP